MGVRVIAVACVTLAFAGRAAAGGREDGLALARQGTERAAAGDLAGAIVLFKRAHAADGRAEYQCNVGAAYFKLRDLPRAQAFLSVCLARAGSLKPEVAATFRDTLTFVDGELRAGGFAPVDVTAEPSGALVRPLLFGDDEGFSAPRTFWLPLGKHTIVATATGHLERRASLTLTRNERLPLHLELAPIPPPVERRKVSRRPAWIALGVAAGSLAVGVTFHLLAADTRSDLSSLPEGPDYDRTRDRFALQRGIAIGGYAGSAVAAGVGLYLLRRAARREAAVAVTPTTGGWLLAAAGRF